MRVFERIEVECYSGYKADERPVAFVRREGRYEITEIMDRWYEGGLEPGRPEADYFKVRSSENEVFLLCYIPLSDEWSLYTGEEEDGPRGPDSHDRSLSKGGQGMADEIMVRMIRYFGDDARRTNHAVKVHGFAGAICGGEGISGTTGEIIMLAAILHDIGIKEAERKYGSSAGKYQEMEGPPIAGQILREAAIEEKIVERVLFLIGNHHTYSKIDGIDFQILVEADFIVNIFEDAMKGNAVESVRKKYFKTRTGRDILDSLYPSGRA